MFNIKLLPLPDDICEHIEFFILSDISNIIIKYWYKYLDKKINLIKNIVKLNNYCPLNNKHSLTLYKASKIISGNEDNDWWVNFIWEIIDSLTDSINYRFLNIQQSNSYDLSVYSCRILANKFNILNNVDYYIYHQDTSTDNPY